MAADPAAGAWLLWTRTDARDAAVACRLALETESVPSGPYNITGAEIALPAAALDLVRTHLGAVTEIRSPLPGHASPMSCLRAQQAFGYAPRYIWRLGQSHPEEDTR